MDLSQLANFGPWGGILAVGGILIQKWLKQRKFERRLAKIEEIVNTSQSSDQTVTQLKLRFQCWNEDAA